MKKNYQKGEVVGPQGMIYVEEADGKLYGKRLFRRAIFECGYCGNITRPIVINSVIRKNNKGTGSCGCLAQATNERDSNVINRNIFHFEGRTNGYRVRIKGISIGYFPTLESAITARNNHYKQLRLEA